MNIAQWIEHVTAELDRAGLAYGHGTACAADEAAWLVLDALDRLSPGEPEAADAEVGPGQAARIEALLAARIERRVPLAYLTGRTCFAGLEFEVAPAVLVPRSPIAELIVERFAPWRRPEQLHRVLDLCTGSGCIAIATAVHLPGTRVDAADISAAALAVAARNVARHGVGDRVRLHRSDLFAALQGRRYDLIVTNPPYVPTGEIAGLPAEFRAEPELGLASGPAGLDACLRIMLESPQYLEERGILICEVGASQQRLERLLPRVPFVWLEFAHGGSGVFLLERAELQAARPALERALEVNAHV